MSSYPEEHYSMPNVPAEETPSSIQHNPAVCVECEVFVMGVVASMRAGQLRNKWRREELVAKRDALALFDTKLLTGQVRSHRPSVMLCGLHRRSSP